MRHPFFSHSFNAVLKRLPSFLGMSVLFLLLNMPKIYAISPLDLPSIEVVQACVLAKGLIADEHSVADVASCLAWHEDEKEARCGGEWVNLSFPEETTDTLRLLSDSVILSETGRSTLKGHVSVRDATRIIDANTAYIDRDKEGNVTHIELIGGIRYLSQGRLFMAEKAMISPTDKSGEIENALYRFNPDKPGFLLPAWGWAKLVKRFPNEDYELTRATYSTCPPGDNAWHLEARSIYLNDEKSEGVARDTTLYLGKLPVLYSPFLTFPTTSERKTGFLLPTIGTSTTGGGDFAFPWYWNIAPNMDATLTPEVYTRRGAMMGGQFRYLTPSSSGEVNGRIIPYDSAYQQFIHDNENAFPFLSQESATRWSFRVYDFTQMTPEWSLGVNVQRVSDDNYLEDFNTNMAVMTERQLLQEGFLAYASPHWFLRGMVQSYQTLQPVFQTPVNDVYQRLPQLQAFGTFHDMPFGSDFMLFGQFDDFRWPNHLLPLPEGPRFYLNPALTLPYVRPYGFFKPAVEVVLNDYTVLSEPYKNDRHFSNVIPRYSLDTGLFFERDASLFNYPFVQTLEPELYYLYVPYRNQTPIPVYDSTYFIFNMDQLFRVNRFSGLDRISDANQLSFALTTRWLSYDTGAEKASLSVGQIRYFSRRQVKLCQSITGTCEDNPFVLGYLSPNEGYSPLASRFVYHLNSRWAFLADYIFDPATNATNNAHVDFHYDGGFNHLFSAGYTYMVLGDITKPLDTLPQNAPLHQASVSVAWPLNEKWSSVGAYGYNISKQYDMISLLGLQYDSCCWAWRLVGGRNFMNLSPLGHPEYNNSLYLQVQLKGLGAIGNSDPSSLLKTFVPGYVDSFHR